MSPSAAPVTAQLKQLIYYHLDTESLENAEFLASRLHAIEPRNPDSSHLLALAYLRLHRYKAAYDTAQRYGANGRHLGCAYTFALASRELERYQDGILALDKSKSLWAGRNHWNKHSETTRRHLPDAAAVYNLLGKLWRGYGDLRKAGDCLIEAHKANAFVWDAFQGLCDISADIDMEHTFQPTTEMMINDTVAALPPDNTTKDDTPLGNQPLAMQLNNNHQNVLTPSNDPFNTVLKNNGGEWNLPRLKAKNIFGNTKIPPSQPSWETPTGNSGEDIDMLNVPLENQLSLDEVPLAPSRRSKTTLQRLGFEPSRDPSKSRPQTIRQQVKSASDIADADDAASTASTATGRMPTAHKRTLSGHSTATASDASTAPRRSNRLFHQFSGGKTSNRAPVDPTSLAVSKREGELRKAKPVAPAVKGRGTSTVGRVVSGNRKVMPPAAGDVKEGNLPTAKARSAVPPMPAMRQLAETTIVPDNTAVKDLLSVFRALGMAYFALSRYEAKEAIEAFQALPSAQRDTPWVQAQLGKAYYEAADYASSEVCFARMLKMQPSHVEDMEVYSSVLWQLKKPIQLSYLAHTLRDLDFHAPQTWCTVGNAFSLSREHEQAIACFKRATQLDPRFSYAWTLMGHELLTNEEFDAALTAYRKGVGAERRGYAGWYGLGKCYERMGKWEDAERHYRIAASINPSNSLLAVCVGVVLEKMQHPREALAKYTHALTLAPNSLLARFRKARVQMHLAQYGHARIELEQLKDMAPEDANVHYLLGRCYKAVGARSEAVRAFTIAMNLDAKASEHIKEAMEALSDADDMDQDSDDRDGDW